MVNFIIKDPDSFHLDPVIKKYKVDQDKYIHPKATFRNTLRTLKRAFPEKNFNFKELRITEGISTFDFTDGFLNQHGKGATKDQAKASAIMEFAERLSWINFDYKNSPGYIKTSFNELRKNNDIDDIKKCFYIAYSQKKEKLYELVKDIPLDWIQAYSLTKNKSTYYPISWNNYYSSTNGLASGNIKEEAILQALCEVIERHNVSKLILNLPNSSTELIDTNSLDNISIKNLIESFKEKHIDIYLINATHQIKIPTVIACGIAQKPEIEMVRICYGYGCHTDPQKAIIRAMSEFHQGRTGAINKEEIARKVELKRGQWQFKLNIDIDKIINNSKTISYKDLPDLTNDDIKTEILTIVELLAKDGYETIIANKTYPLLKIPVYRAFVPGLLPGSTISSVDENDDFLIVLAYFQGNQIDKAKEYYQKNFKNIIKNMDIGLDLITQFFPNISMEKINSLLTPQIFPIELICTKDYQEQAKLSLQLMSGNKEILKKMFGSPSGIC